MASNTVKVEATLDEKGLVSGVKSSKAALEELGAAGTSAAKATGDGFTVAKGIIANMATKGIELATNAVKDFAVQVVEIGSNFESSMSKVSALSGATGDDLAKLEAKARELGASTTFSASEAADALGYMALAGWDTAQMLDGVGSVLTLAQAGEMDLAAASDLVTDYLSAFNMEASETARMVDVLAYAQANANTTVEGLGMAFKNCAANANAAGMDVETTSAAIAMMANQGLKGSEAGTALNAVLRDMTAQMKDGAIAIGKQKVAVMDAEGNYRDFVDILADVEAATDGMGEAEKAAALQSTFTADSIKGLNLMLNAGAGETAKFREELYNCAGTADATAKTMTDNLGGDVAAMGSAFEEFALKVYESVQEPLREAVQFITNTVIPGVTMLVENIDTVGPALVGIGAGIALVVNKAKLLKTMDSVHAAWTKAVTKTETAMKSAGTTVTGYGMKTKTAATAQKTFAASAGLASTAVKTQTTYLKASEIAMKAGGAAARALGTALKTVAPIAAMTALVEVASHISSSLADASEQSKTFEKCTSGVTGALKAYDDAFASAAGSVDGFAASAGQAATATESIMEANAKAIESQGQLADSLNESLSTAGTNVGLVEKYSESIARLGEKGQLSASEQAELQTAIAGVNDIMGTSYSIIDTQTGKLSANKDEILAVADAWRESAQAQALQEAIIETEKQQQVVTAQLESAKAKLAETEHGLYVEMGGVEVLSDEQGRAYHELEQQVSTLEASQQANADTLSVLNGRFQEHSEAMQATSQALTSYVEQNSSLAETLSASGIELGTFAETLSQVGISTQDLTAIMAQEGQAGIDGFISAYQNGTSSLIAWCAENGIQIPYNLANGITTGQEAVSTAAQGNMDAFLGPIQNGVSQAQTAGSVMSSAGAAGAGAAGSQWAAAGSSVTGQFTATVDLGAGTAAGTALGSSTGQAAQAAGQQSMTQGGQASGKAYDSGLKGTQGTVESTSRTIAQDGANAMKTDDFYNSGVYAGDGLVNGMGSTMSRVIAKAQELARAAVEAIKKEGQQGSPWKTTFRSGRWGGLGLAQGFESTEDIVAASAASLSRTAVKGMEPLLSMPSGIDWNATGGTYNSVRALGLTEEAVQARLAQTSAMSAPDNAASVEIMRSMLEEIRMLRRELPDMLARYCLRALEINDREFARLVRNTEAMA